MLRKSTKVNRKIRKALVYYRTRTRENRKITSTWNSLGLGKWCSDGCVKVGDIEVWAYYYFYEGENPDLCNWEDRMEIKVEECWI